LFIEKVAFSSVMTRVGIAFAIAVALVFAALSPGQSQLATGRVTGLLVDQQNALPISGAIVSLLRAGAPIATSKSNALGAFTLSAVDGGLYVLLVDASGYEVSRSREFAVTQGQETKITLVVNRAVVEQQTNLKTIGNVSVSSTGALASTTTISRTIDPVVLQKENFIRLADGLVRLPGVNGAGLSSSVGDDTYLNIRGLGSSETQALLDGHPVGPQGVYGINGGGSFPNAFNYADTPFFGLSKVLVTFGSGASGLFGVDAIGGTVDLQTLMPTTTPHFGFVQSLGDQGRSQTTANATGSFGKFRYAFAGGVQGTYGLFAPGLVAQTGRPNNNPNLAGNGACTAGNDVSACNLALNTYSVSQNTLLKSGLAKLRYDLSPNTAFTATLYASGHQADSTGNGDNDNIPYDTRLAQIQNNVTPSNVAAGPGVTPSCLPGPTQLYQVITTASGQTACYTAQKWASASSGPFGGGQDRNRGTNMADYHFHLQSTSGPQTFSADGFHNHYKYYKSSEQAGGLDATGTAFAGSSYTQYLDTNGWLVSDDIQSGSSDIGFGYFGEYQLGTRLNHNAAGQGLYNYNAPEQAHYNSGFARGELTLSPKISSFASFWIKNSSVDATTSFDPRLSLVYRPAPSDILRVTFGHSTGDPAAELKATGPPTINANPSSLNPSCTPYNSIGTGGNPTIKPERSNDYEVGYAHKFRADSSIQLNLYYTAVGDQLFSAAEPVTQFGAVAIPSNLLAGFATKIAAAGCAGVNPADPMSVIPYLAISTTFNTASAISKGIELTGRQRLTRRFYVDYAYNLQSVVQNGVNEGILRSNPFIINGAQIQGIPRNQANLGVDYANLGLEFRMDGYFIGSNNPKERPAYNTWDGFVSKSLTGGLSFSLGVQNLFDQASQNYGYFGHQLFIPENQFNHDTNSIQQYVNTGSGEQFGLPSRSFSVTVSKRI